MSKKFPKIKVGDWIEVRFIDIDGERPDRFHPLRVTEVDGEYFSNTLYRFFIKDGAAEFKFFQFVRKLSKKEAKEQDHKELKDEVIACVHMMSYERLKKLYKWI